jgi:hypothetical protein
MIEVCQSGACGKCDICWGRLKNMRVQREKVSNAMHMSYYEKILGDHGWQWVAQESSYTDIITSFIVGAPSEWLDVWKNEVGESLVRLVDAGDWHNRRREYGDAPIKALFSLDVRSSPKVSRVRRIYTIIKSINRGLRFAETVNASNERARAYAFLYGYGGIKDSSMVNKLLALDDQNSALRLVFSGVPMHHVSKYVESEVDATLVASMLHGVSF